MLICPLAFGEMLNNHVKPSWNWSNQKKKRELLSERAKRGKKMLRKKNHNNLLTVSKIVYIWNKVNPTIYEYNKQRGKVQAILLYMLSFHDDGNERRCHTRHTHK